MFELGKTYKTNAGFTYTLVTRSEYEKKFGEIVDENITYFGIGDGVNSWQQVWDKNGKAKNDSRYDLIPTLVKEEVDKKEMSKEVKLEIGKFYMDSLGGKVEIIAQVKNGNFLGIERNEKNLCFEDVNEYKPNGQFGNSGAYDLTGEWRELLNKEFYICDTYGNNDIMKTPLHYWIENKTLDDAKKYANSLRESNPRFYKISIKEVQ